MVTTLGYLPQGAMPSAQELYDALQPLVGLVRGDPWDVRLEGSGATIDADVLARFKNNGTGGILELLASNDALRYRANDAGNELGGPTSIVGPTTITGTLDVSDDTTVGGTLGVTGAATFDATVDIDGNTTVGGTLGVTGATTIGGTLGVTGAATFDAAVGIGGTLDVSDDTTIGGTLGVTGAATFDGAVALGNAAGDAITVTGTITLAGNGQRVLADFSNGTEANRAMFQSSGSNSATHVGVLPSGSGTTGGIALYNSSSPGNSSVIQIQSQTSAAILNSGAVGSGTVNPLRLQVNGTTRIELNGTGIGFFAATPVAKPTVSGSRGGNAALASLLTGLANLGLITNSSSA